MLMDFDMLVAKHHLEVSGVLHVGAHLAEEAPIYDRCAVGEVTWVEANAQVLQKIRRALLPYPTQRVVHALVHETDGTEMAFHITNHDGMSSSVLQFGTHPDFSPDTVFVDHITMRTTTIDTIVAKHNVTANLLVMDIQGAELAALKGAQEFLKGVTSVLSEVNEAEVYVGCAKAWEMDAFLAPSGFVRVETCWVRDQHWGDALWVRR